MDRRRQELELVRQKYLEFEHGEQLDWVIIPNFPLPPGWNRDRTRLLFCLPPEYPANPPDNFYVELGLQTSAGALPGNYDEGPESKGHEFHSERWGRFSFHRQGEWRPSANLTDGDNLLTFLLMVEQRLREAS